jgi:MoxR-like ATPase
MNVADIASIGRDLVAALSKVIVGKEEVLRRIIAAILADGHILLEDYPGLAKTLIARLIGQALDLEFHRIQCTPDVLPADITGSFVYDQRDGRFAFRRGPIFTNLLLADEANRATPKTQSALLEAMEERQVTVEGETFLLERPFLVIATQNPIELEGTYPLPEAQLDRFLIRLSIGYPSLEEEQRILSRRRDRREDTVALPKLVSRADLIAMQLSLEDVHVAASIERYIAELVQATRKDEQVALGASPRGSLALLKLARAWAALRGEKFVTPDDVKAMALPALAHRIVLRPELWLARASPDQVVDRALHRAPTPAAELEKCAG